MIRSADKHDLDFLVQIDLLVDGITESSETQLINEDQGKHREKIMKFVTDTKRGAFIYEDKTSSERIGMIMYSIVNRDGKFLWKTIFNELDRRLFQEDGRFVEIFQLWVAPDFRRRGIATTLKQMVEEVAILNDVNLIYTHTEVQNLHVIALNKKLGYEEVRQGPIWDEVIRVSLIKKVF
ncbi:GNAT family N-acetyltransferase [Paenibacillus agricola]|uniref:GNAT family N-acetyltransferase n=1 Tax=Paenibacillus agricola TaxID=2716264 RepID=A0ABX0J6M3_9BACL|nr:GNAT family N-acetyltransferase [Paenibacillus agricola]NHN30478.1 GNAT family N-acetyltransferase [Paenibacillus agricola]